MGAPVPYGENEVTRNNASSGIELDKWITKPFESPTVNWTLVTKEAETYAVHYYTMTEEGANDNGTAHTKYIGDVLYIKVDNGRVIDADYSDVETVLRDMRSSLRVRIVYVVRVV